MPPKKKDKDSNANEDTSTRIAIITAEKCKPKKCNQECKKSCPVVKLGKLCIEVGEKSKVAFISEPLCIGTSLYFSLIFFFCLFRFRAKRVERKRYNCGHLNPPIVYITGKVKKRKKQSDTKR